MMIDLDIQSSSVVHHDRSLTACAATARKPYDCCPPRSLESLVPELRGVCSTREKVGHRLDLARLQAGHIGVVWTDVCFVWFRIVSLHAI